MFSSKNKKIAKSDEAKKNRNSFNTLKNPEILEVNLVKDEVIIFFDWSKALLSATLVFILSTLFVFEIYLGLDYWEQRENERSLLIEQETSLLKNEIVDLSNKAKDALSYKEKSQAFSDILSNHIYWTRFFSWLERNTISSVKYEGFSGDLSGSYSLKAVAPSYAEVSWQVKAFSDNPMVKSVKVENVDYSTIEKDMGEGQEPLVISKVSFNIDLEIDNGIFKKN